MSIPEVALRKTLIEMDNQLQKNKSELSITDLQLQRQLTNLKIADLTIKELTDDKPQYVWENCGKMFFKTDLNTYNDKLNNEKKIIDEQVNALTKKKHYLETSLNVTFDNMKKYLAPQKD
ncbi:hypothetical protein PACTADRAFT_69185 [Pachysolen tannophilus NRRL Y-2460]|uniref:Prefoldin subunit 1 n=1 Tax=Pachysolen tannophilus NRRL Y-2460 TaxID=669874 RepID=A0A1E4TVA4_PACTA|nr:hypothetical protein PACTADRAFT_69185 [Pachysolen tannophilus NRRL Y-2460]